MTMGEVKRIEWYQWLMAGYSWETTFAFYTRVKTVQAAKNCCHADHTSLLLLLLPLTPVFASNQEVAQS